MQNSDERFGFIVVRFFGFCSMDMVLMKVIMVVMVVLVTLGTVVLMLEVVMTGVG